MPPLNPQAGYKTSMVLRAGPNGWRHQGSKPHGRDSRHEAWRNAREPDGDNAGMLEIGQQDFLHSKYCCFVEYRYGQIKMANRHRVPRMINTWLQLKISGFLVSDKFRRIGLRTPCTRES